MYYKYYLRSTYPGKGIRGGASNGLCHAGHKCTAVRLEC